MGDRGVECVEGMVEGGLDGRGRGYVGVVVEVVDGFSFLLGDGRLSTFVQRLWIETGILSLICVSFIECGLAG